MKRFNSNKVRALGNLQSQSDLQKRYNRRVRGIMKPFSAAVGPVEMVKPKERDFLTCVRADWSPPKIRGANGTRISPAKRAAIQARQVARAAFFAELGREG